MDGRADVFSLASVAYTLIAGRTAVSRADGPRHRKALVFKLHEGSFRDELDMAPGLHEVRLEVTWDDTTRVERIIGNFRSDDTRRLEASLGRIRRDLSLAWR